jgi:uncharacterized protein YdeI (YjbR/CyaY-like superfamily)
MKDSVKSDQAILLFEDQPAWGAWLQVNHSQPAGMRIKISKKGSGYATLTYEQAVESALCYGWIDSQATSCDRYYYLQKFSPRRSTSKWSILNREKAEVLISAGRMQPAGFEQIELAKADGRWESAYDPQSRITAPEDFQKELDQNQAASEFFNTLNSINRYAILHRMQDARKPETRAARIQKYVELLANEQKIVP